MLNITPMPKLIHFPKMKKKQPSSPSSPLLYQRTISFEEASTICNHFDEQNQLGKGSFGFGQLFKGRWNGQDVTVKRISKKDWMQINTDYEIYVKYFLGDLQVYFTIRLLLSQVNVISRSHFKRPIYYRLLSKKIIGYCYHSVNVITFDLAQFDHIKGLLLYFSTRLLSLHF